MFKRNKTFIIMMCIFLSLLIAGCGVNKENSGNNLDATTVITDQQGRLVEIPVEVNRVVTSYGPATNLVFAIGGQEKLVAVPDQTHSNDFLTSVYPEIKNIEEIGSRREGLNMEAVIASEPDVVILFPGNDNETFIQQLTTQKIPVIVINPESTEQILECIEILGTALGKQEQARALITYYEEKLDEVTKRVANIASEQRRKVYLSGSGGILTTTSADMYQHHIIESAGGINVASLLKGGWNQVSAEQLIQFNPDFIASVQYTRVDVAQEILDNPHFKNIQAISDGEVYLFPSNFGGWDMPEPRSILGIMWLADRLYPELFEDLDILEEIDAFHLNFYGKTFTELGGILNDNQIIERIDQ